MATMAAPDREASVSAGRWMVVDCDGELARYRRISKARAAVARDHAVGIRSVVRRYRRDRIEHRATGDWLVWWDRAYRRWWP